jgi:uridine phosphorylase
MAPSLVGRGELDLTIPQRAGVLSMDMETSLVFTLGAIFEIATASMCLITVQAEPHVHLEAPIRGELDDRLVRAALAGIVAFGDH